MKIETKFDINQEIYFVIDNVEKGKINSIYPYIKENEDECFTNYGITEKNGYALRLSEDQIFATQEEAEAKSKEIYSKRLKCSE